MTIWMQSLHGRALDVVDPVAEQVDFREIAEALARTNRYGGHTEMPVSVAQHTLICMDAAMDKGWHDDVPWVLLHDAHEYIVGDVTTPVSRAIHAITGRDCLSELKRRHDVAIHEAAGLRMPDAAQRELIKVCDITALMTERRDFMGRPPRAWDAEHEATPALKRRYRAHSVAVAADRLYAEFRRYLPALIRENGHAV